MAWGKQRLSSIFTGKELGFAMIYKFHKSMTKTNKKKSTKTTTKIQSNPKQVSSWDMRRDVWK